jgi:hypothetical protein
MVSWLTIATELEEEAKVVRPSYEMQPDSLAVQLVNHSLFIPTKLTVKPSAASIRNQISMFRRPSQAPVSKNDNNFEYHMERAKRINGT